MARIAVVNVPHHVTQRGNARQLLLTSAAERLVYLELLQRYGKLYQLSLLGYCLMSNHVHLVVVPRQPDSLATALKHTHGRYASYWNAVHKSSGHVWQGRFYSCPLDSAHLWIALRYAERNPVRANMVADAASWTWSSAAAHCAAQDAPPWLDLEMWSRRWSARSWREYLATEETEDQVAAIRQSTHAGRPLGTTDFLHSLEHVTQRRLAPQKGGRPRKIAGDPGQTVLSFDRWPCQTLVRVAETMENVPSVPACPADIIKDLQSGEEPLLVKPDGTVMNGNTRLLVLEERGIDINGLGLKPQILNTSPMLEPSVDLPTNPTEKPPDNE